MLLPERIRNRGSKKGYGGAVSFETVSFATMVKKRLSNAFKEHFFQLW